ncbi:MAG: hypothetical protein H7099_11435 [Gemmatimonadaceae bacterium]|nr:hypothetical protein [Gemmatimonadaceae bacterium]
MRIAPCLALTASVLCATANAQTLSNAHLRVTFGARGISAVTDLASASTDRFISDEAAIAIGADAIDTRMLDAPTREIVSDGVVYHHVAGTYRIDVRYELRPHWRFVSKQLVVTALVARKFTVMDVTLFRAVLARAPTDVFRPMSAQPALGTFEYGAAMRFGGTHSLLLVAQNPFLHAATDGREVTLRYAPEMEWSGGNGAFESDRALLAPVTLTGRRIPAAMTPEWQTVDRGTPGLDEAEVATFTHMVRSSLLYEPTDPLNVFVGWCVNDYQIDVGTAAGRAEYRRVFDRAASVGAQYVLYAPSNSALSRREESLDDWSWEHVLWLGLGQKIRRGEWDPRTSAIPPSLQEMLDAARARKLRLLAYVYPVMPFSQNPDWLVPSRRDSTRKSASLGNRALQDWLIEELVAFHARTGIAGYSFDHTFLNYEGTSRYAQWYGWRRVMEELRRRIPDIVLDGRQAHHLYGPWSYLAGSYPHPTFHDEQPESFTPYPDLHFDRVSANRERYTAYRFRNYEFTPNELVPGFMTHQTPRLDETDDMPQAKTADRGMVILPFRTRDWDYLGWKYSVLSSIAVGGWNNVINMLPARDSAENASFSAADAAWLRGWLEWTARHKELLRRTKQILGQPGLGKLDGSAMIDGDHGYIFLFNPDPRALTARIALDASIGLTTSGSYMLREVFPQPGAAHASRVGYSARGDTLPVRLDGGSALVLEITRVNPVITKPVVIEGTGTARLVRDTLVVDSVLGVLGRLGGATVALPPSARVSVVRLNGHSTRYFFRNRDVVSILLRFGAELADDPLSPAVRWDSTRSGGRVQADVRIAPQVFDQLQARRAAWPIPWTADDLRTTWLASERLLLWAPIADADDRLPATLSIDGTSVPLHKAYTSIQPEHSTFTGYYADVSTLEAGRTYRIELQLPPLARGQFLGLYLANVEPIYVPGTPIARP